MHHHPSVPQSPEDHHSAITVCNKCQRVDVRQLILTPFCVMRRFAAPEVTQIISRVVMTGILPYELTPGPKPILGHNSIVNMAREMCE